MTIYYVATNGSNANDGSASAPFETIQHAVNSGLQPGDEIVVRPGTYTEQIWITADGAEDAYITIRSEVPGAAEIRPPDGAYSTVNLRSNYVVVEGFDIVGGGGHGIDAESVHHTKILNNVIHNSGGSGIQYNYSDFIHIEGNVTHSNASTNGFHTSGISLYQNRNISDDVEDGQFRNVVKDNISYNNIEGPTILTEHTDGNGIIIDDFRNTQVAPGGGDLRQGPAFGEYVGETLVEGNLVYENGGKGIQVYLSDNITVRNNTAYNNNLDNVNPGTWRGELSNAQSSNNTWVNNIAVTDPDVNVHNNAIADTSHSGYVNENIVWENNLTFSGTEGEPSINSNNGPILSSDGNLIGVDPRFVDPENGDFRLQSDSPAIDAGTGAFGLSPTDLNGDDRTIGPVDLGVYEFEVSGTTPPTTVANRDPIARDDYGYDVEEGEALTIAASSLMANDRDPDGDALTIASVGVADGGGSASLNAAGDVIFQAGDGAGTTRLTYTLTDDEGATAQADVFVSVDAKPVEPADPIIVEPPVGSLDFTLEIIDLATLDVLATLEDGDVLALEDYSGRKVTMVATPIGSSVGSVSFASDQFGSRIENVKPYALFSDYRGVFSEDGAVLTEKSYSLDLTAFSGRKGKGDILGAQTINFSVEAGDTAVDPEPEIPSSGDFEFALVDVDTGEVVTSFADGEVIVSEMVEGRELTIVVTPESDGIQSVAIDAGDLGERVESVVPYALFGDNKNGDLHGGMTLGNGEYTVSATGYSKNGARGDVVSADEVTFTVADVAPPMVTPIPDDGGSGNSSPDGTSVDYGVPGTGDPMSASIGSDFVKFFLADSDSDDTLAPITEQGQSFDVESDAKTLIYAEALSDSGEVGSLAFIVDGTRHVESVAPYSLFGDVRGDFYDGKGLGEGSHLVTVEVYSGAGASGQLLETTELIFDLI
ncbi:MAG: cadherin-like domain-containing protein [Pseudomonadota bacterium]